MRGEGNIRSSLQTLVTIKQRTEITTKLFKELQSKAEERS
jgi:lipid II:glycine glycyltransferase (peptidoglycan interpeptide bridge formation enzyme)